MSQRYLARRFSCKGIRACPCKSEQGRRVIVALTDLHTAESGWDGHRHTPGLAAERYTLV